MDAPAQYRLPAPNSMTTSRTFTPRSQTGRLLAWSFLLLTGATNIQRASATPILPSQRVPADEVAISVPANVSLADIDRVLVFVARNRKWSIDRREPGVVELSLKHREFDARFFITYDQHQLTIRSQSTTRDGRSAVPVRWLTAFVGDVLFQFNAKHR